MLGERCSDEISPERIVAAHEEPPDTEIFRADYDPHERSDETSLERMAAAHEASLKVLGQSPEVQPSEGQPSRSQSERSVWQRITRRG